jgi:hypothetical protein
MSTSVIERFSLDEAISQGVRGGIGGLAGGVIFGFWMAHKGMFSVIASMVGQSSAPLGLLMHLCISIGIGVSFGVLFSRLANGVIPSSVWGLMYGFVWWFLGPLTLMPVFMGMGVQWTGSAVAGSLPSLLWHLIYGGVLGVSYAALTRWGVRPRTARAE